MFRLDVSLLQAPIQFRYQMLCPLWDPIVFTFVDYLLAKAFRKVITTECVIFWGNSPHGINIFKIQKRIIRIMTNSNRRETCRPLFHQLGILPLPSQYIFSLLLLLLLTRNYSHIIHKFMT